MRKTDPADPFKNALHVAVRLNEETIGRIARILATMGKRASEFGVYLTQSDVMRAAVTRGLTDLEREYGITPGSPTPPLVSPPRRGRPPGKTAKPAKPRKPRK